MILTVRTILLLASVANKSHAFVATAAAIGKPSALQQPLTKINTYAAASSASLVNNRHSASDWLYNIKSLPQSEVLREVKSPVIAVAAFSAIVSVMHKVVGDSICIPGTAHGFLVSALGLLLVFRTNSAYQRFNVSRVTQILRNIINCNH
jgi:hypothetical protein